MTKQQIIDRELTSEELEFFGDKAGNLFDAMDECAKQQAIAFAEWIDGNGFRRMRGRKNKERVYGNWYVPSAGYGGGEPTTFTTDQLFQLFLEHQTKHNG